MICTNPITGTPGRNAEAKANLGTLVPSSDFSSAVLQKGMVGARCDKRGVLTIGDAPEGVGGQYVLPGNNYHVFDYSLFWANVRADAERRLKAFKP